MCLEMPAAGAFVKPIRGNNDRGTACYTAALQRREWFHGSAHHRSLRQFHPWRHRAAAPFSTGWREIAGSSAAALALLPLLQNDYARAAIVAPDDARLAIDTVSYDAGGTRISGYLARLKAKGKRPAVIVIHENRGLNPHIQDIARRLALEGFLAFAVDMLSPLGGTPADEDKARDMIGTLNADETARRIAAAVPFLEHHAGIDRQGRRRRLLLGRRHGQPHRGAGARPEGGRRLLRPAAAGRPRCNRSRRRCCCTMPGSTSA